MEVSQNFIDTIARMTDENLHSEVYRAVAEWCIANFPDIPTQTGRDLKARFQYYADYWDGLIEFSKKVGCHPFWEVSYEMGKLLDRDIVTAFGKETLDRLNEGR